MKNTFWTKDEMDNRVSMVGTDIIPVPSYWQIVNYDHVVWVNNDPSGSTWASSTWGECDILSVLQVFVFNNQGIRQQRKGISLFDNIYSRYASICCRTACPRRTDVAPSVLRHIVFYHVECDLLAHRQTDQIWPESHSWFTFLIPYALTDLDDWLRRGVVGIHCFAKLL